jgi:hypothetical protein
MQVRNETKKSRLKNNGREKQANIKTIYREISLLPSGDVI